jgi:hypothetical protein
MCSLTDNLYKIEFNEFNIRDMDSGVQLFHVAKDPNMPDIDPATIPPELEDQVRCIQYDFGADFLQLRTIGTQLTFSIGPHEVPNFRMIERHYFRNYMIRSFDFTFGCAQQPYRCRAALRGPPPEAFTPSALHSRLRRLPSLLPSLDTAPPRLTVPAITHTPCASRLSTRSFCIPNTTNTWEAIYELPDLEPELMEVPHTHALQLSVSHSCRARASPCAPLAVRSHSTLALRPFSSRFQDMINNPWETQSDSFYFVDDVMVMHNKAKYAYTPAEY